LAEETPIYVLDDDTKELFEQMMNYAQRYIDLQMSEEVYSECQADLEELADRFGLDKSEVDIVTDQVDEKKGIIKLTIKSRNIESIKRPEEIRKTFRLISNSEDDDDEPTKH
tara:strand:- start:203 stop:538 length:336 start_codon:yes stop_codon:yes gene_type:complete